MGLQALPPAPSARSLAALLGLALFLGVGLWVGAASGETRLGPLVITGEVEGGWHEISGSPGSAEFEEYRDEEQWVGRGHFLLEDEGGRYFLRGLFEDVGQGDERYRIELGRRARWELRGSFREIPHSFSTNARTPYRRPSDDTLVLPFARPAPDLTSAVGAALRGQDLEFRSIYGEGGFSWKILENLELSSEYRLIDKKGTSFRGGLGQPFAGAFNVFPPPFMFDFVLADFAAFATPVDEKIHELTAGVDWVGEGLSLSVGYVGSVYDNEVGDSLTVDSPFVDADRDVFSSRWRQALAPDNQSHTVNLAGAWVLPAPFPARLTGTLSYGMRLQEDDFIPMTVNSVWAGDPRLRPSQDDLGGRVETVLADFRFTSRPRSTVHVDGHYRYYDYDNQSDVVRLAALVVNDATLADDAPGSDRFSVPNGYERHDAEIEASWRLREGVKLGLGYAWERWKRSGDRQVRETDEHGPEVWLDLRPASWAQVRSRYAYRARNRSDYGPFNFIEDSFAPALVEAAETLDVFPEVRNAPLAALHGHEARFQALLQPVEGVSFAVNGGLDFDDYHRSEYGLRDDERWWAGADASWSPLAWLDLSVHYTFERWLLVQQSRFRDVAGAMVGGDVPGNDWSTNTTEIAHNVGSGLEIELLPGRLWADVGYDFQRATVRTRAGSAFLDPTEPAALDFPTVRNSLHVVRTVLTYRVNEMLKIKGYYRWERYVEQDFHLDDSPIVILAAPGGGGPSVGSVLLGNEVDDYRAHVWGGTLVLEF